MGTPSYQWLADDVAIAGASGSGYTLTSAEQGKTVKVTVSFAADAGHEETRTSWWPYRFPASRRSWPPKPRSRG